MTPRLKEALALTVTRAGGTPPTAHDALDALSSIDCLAARMLAERGVR
jgi:hypothetical protein